MTSFANVPVKTPASDTLLGYVVPQHDTMLVQLPPDPELAERTVKSFFDGHGLLVQTFSSADREKLGLDPLSEDTWCFGLSSPIRLPFWRLFPDSLLARVQTISWQGEQYSVFVWPKYSITIVPKYAQSVLNLLEHTKEQMYRDERGLPLPWISSKRSTFSLESAEDNQHEEQECHCWELDAHEANTEKPQDDGTSVDSGTIAEVTTEFDRICQHLGFSPFPLRLLRSLVHRNGYVSGRIVANKKKQPVNMEMTLCPNADRAEMAATLVHEFAHLVSGMVGHDADFKRAMVDLASALYGDAFFAEPRQRLDRSYRILDMWVATGIRASLRGMEPPVAKSFDEQLTAGVVSRIQKMRALAADQPGTPEAITATALANTQITLYQLGSYQIRFHDNIDENMMDRWISVGKHVRWKRNLAFIVAKFCNVFALSRVDEGWMHFFGKYRDLVAAEYLYQVCVEHVERKCEQYIKAWKEKNYGYGKRPSAGDVRSEKTSFCISAVNGIKNKMDEIRYQEKRQAETQSDSAEAHGYQLTSEDLEKAREFTLAESQKRGMGNWSHDRSYTYIHNDEGYEAGQDVQLHHGVGVGKVRGLLGS